jgi:sulfur oxidation c-type cytochrome SoxX
MIWSCNWLKVFVMHRRLLHLVRHGLRIAVSVRTALVEVFAIPLTLRQAQDRPSSGRADLSVLLCKQARFALLPFFVLLAACAPLPVAIPNEPTAPPSAASLQQGWRILFDQRLGNCVACHSIPNEQGKKSGIQSTFAPALDGVAARNSAAQLRQWVVDARKINPDTMMPPFGQMLTPQQVTDVLAALQTLR